MADVQTGSPLEVAGVTGPHATEAFSLLANETRLAILLALWECHEPGAEDTTASFSELFDRIEYDNAGNFSYHLAQLEGPFIRKHPEDGGYEIKKTGLKVVRSVIAGAGIEDVSREETEIDRPCHRCEAPTAVTYEDGVLYQICTECEGITTQDGLPEGYLNACELDPAGLTGRSADELIAAAEVAAYRHMRTMYQGLCSACSGPVEARLEICEDHDAEGVCATCRREPAYTAHFLCRVCNDFHGTTPDVLTVFHPAVIAFHYDHGVTPRWHAEEYDGLTHVGEAEATHETDLVSADPPRVAVTIAYEDEDLRVTYDETVTVVDVEW